ncbi:hypothetical protein KC357_g304 [Hortaea werneckii]|nr:hypothetical protein KC357_g304 [Hortaea werneckii]
MAAPDAIPRYPDPPSVSIRSDAIPSATFGSSSSSLASGIRQSLKVALQTQSNSSSTYCQRLGTSGHDVKGLCWGGRKASTVSFACRSFSSTDVKCFLVRGGRILGAGDRSALCGVCIHCSSDR